MSPPRRPDPETLDLEAKVDAIYDALVGTPDSPGLGEKVRNLETRVSSIERLRMAVIGGATAALTALAAAWTVFLSGPPRPPHP